MNKGQKCFLLVLLLAVMVIVNTQISFGQSNETQAPPPDPCAGVTCTDSTTACPDGFSASCTNSCSSGICSQCTPSCEGHASQQPQQPACPPSPEKPQCPSDAYPKEKVDSNSCIIDYECVPSVTTPPSTCPPSPERPTCSGDAYPKERQDANNCVVGYDCISSPKACPQLSQPGPDFCVNGYTKPRYDANNCVTGYDCVQGQCAQVITPAMDDAGHCQEFQSSCLPPGWRKVDTCNRFIPPVCGDGKCDIGEDINNCHDDCGPYDYRDNRQQCPDGTAVICKTDSTGGKVCEPCPVTVPAGCRQEKDERGSIRVICDTQRACPDIPQDVRLKCVDQKGIPVFKKGPSGCDEFFCQFGNEVSNPFSGYQQCPSSQQVDAEMQKCSSIGLRGMIAFEGGCKIARCVEERGPVEQCGMISGHEREKIENECRQKGLGTLSRFEGCRQVIECGQGQQGTACANDMPPEAYNKCSEGGGELVVQRAEDGCIKFSSCVQRGNVADTYVERPTKIPDSTELLSLAFKLESLKMDLDKLAKNTDDIAIYYKSVGSRDEARFRRISDMFITTKGKVDEIKNKIRNKLESMTEDDVIEIKRDIKYLKDVALKDILYVMLSSSEDVEQLTRTSETTGSDCGKDGMCFDSAFRVCKPVVFEPDQDTIVEIKGVDGDACILTARLKEGKGPPAGFAPGINPPYTMECKIKNYALGMKGPEDIMPFCTGSMAELFKKFGPPPSQRESQPSERTQRTVETGTSSPYPAAPQYAPQQRIRPDQCEFTDMTDQECVDYILKVKGTPPECKGLTDEQCRKFLIKSWENQRQNPASVYGSEGEGNKMGQGYCGDTVCDSFEQQNPSGCPQDCGPLLRQQQQYPVQPQQYPVQQVQPQQYPVQAVPSGGGGSAQPYNP